MWRLAVLAVFEPRLEHLHREAVADVVLDTAGFDTRAFDAGVALAQTDELRIVGERSEIAPVESPVLFELDGENGIDRVGYSGL
ncbi:hypothetical protein C494_03520 [Natronorubrum bangense JCM 10635]|uniref:Uncharacterized protein n=1 Tax=Natronorubrum bangense JCM 10635 TaxID=1227500 RepID=L9WPR4_9EURY|nr:hypothetical protein C494_03520 [Natronorubrum bangense JCM 10635]